MLISPLCIASMLMATSETNPIAVTEGDNVAIINNIYERNLNDDLDSLILSNSREIEILTEEEIEVVEYEYTDYRQTFYSVEQGEVKLGAGYQYTDDEISVIDNVMHFNDNEYGWIPIVAIDMNEVIKSGKDERGVWNIYGSIIEIKYPNEMTTLAIILDACGACRYASKIDMWVYKNDVKIDIAGVEWTYIRKKLVE